MSTPSTLPLAAASERLKGKPGRPRKTELPNGGELRKVLFDREVDALITRWKDVTP